MSIQIILNSKKTQMHQKMFYFMVLITVTITFGFVLFTRENHNPIPR